MGVTVVDGARVRTRAALPAFAGALATAALYVWDDLLFAAPIVAVTAAAGPWIAFAVFSCVYALGSFALAMLAVRAYEHLSGGEPSRMARWLERSAGGRRSRLARRLLATGKLVGFVVCSFLLGGILTTWLIRYSGRNRAIVAVAGWSSAIFGVTFTAFYVGVGAALGAV
jgi:hypothetical protein